MRSAVIKVVAARAELEQSDVDGAKSLAEHGLDDKDFPDVIFDLEEQLDIAIKGDEFSLGTSVEGVVEAVGRVCK